MGDLEDILLPTEVLLDKPSKFIWAVVENDRPLQVRLDGEDNTLAIQPIMLCDVLAGDRVYCHLNGRQLVGIARAKTALDEWSPVTFQNGFVNYSSANATYEQCCYRRDNNDGRLVGLFKHATTTTTGVVTNLPTALRPQTNHIYIVEAGGGEARIDVQSGGNVVINSFQGGGSASFISLSQIRWPLGPVQ